MASRTLYIGKTNAAVLAGDIDVTEWDDEELLRGQRKGKGGKFTGRRPKIVPAVCLDEWKRRNLSAIHQTMAEAMLPAIQRLTELATNPNVEPEVQLKAINALMDRAWGKPTENVNVGVAAVGGADEPAKWEKAIDAGIVALPAESEVIDTTTRALPSYTDDGAEKPKLRKPRKP